MIGGCYRSLSKIWVRFEPRSVDLNFKHCFGHHDSENGFEIIWPLNLHTNQIWFRVQHLTISESNLKNHTSSHSSTSELYFQGFTSSNPFIMVSQSPTPDPILSSFKTDRSDRSNRRAQWARLKKRRWCLSLEVSPEPCKTLSLRVFLCRLPQLFAPLVQQTHLEYVRRQGKWKFDLQEAVMRQWIWWG